MTTDPLISVHARERCAQMGISTKVAKRIYRDPACVMPDFQGHPDRRFMTTGEYAIVVELAVPRDVVVTVLYYAPEGWRGR